MAFSSKDPVARGKGRPAVWVFLSLLFMDGRTHFFLSSLQVFLLETTRKKKSTGFVFFSLMEFKVSKFSKRKDQSSGKTRTQISEGSLSDPTTLNDILIMRKKKK